MDEVGKPEESASAIVARDGEVYLPEKRKLEPDTDEFYTEVASCLPPDVAGIVAARRKSIGRKYRRFEILLILLALTVIAWLVNFNFPKPLPARPFLFEWRYDGPRVAVDSPDLPLYRKVRADFDAGRYEAVIRALNDPLAIAIWTQETAGKEELFFLYFTSCGKSVSPDTDWTRAPALIEALVKADPDQLQWRYLQLLLKRRQLGSYREFYRSLQRAPEKRWQTQLDSIRETLRGLRVLRGKIMERGNSLDDQEALRKRLDFWEAEFLVFAWMLEGGRGGGAFQDNANSPGVTDRERAWVLTRDYPDDIDGLALRHFILDVLLEQDKPLNRIYWNGEAHRTRAPLEDERRKIETRLSGTGRGGDQ